MTRLLATGALGLACLATSQGYAQERTVRVAAVHYTATDAHEVSEKCAPLDTNCAVEALVRRAASGGAQLIVTPEYALEQDRVEPAPGVGVTVDAEGSPLVTRFGKIAAETAAYLVINLRTTAAGKRYNTQIAFGPDGAVAAVHNKFELYGGENEILSAGEDVTVFDTPFGRVGLLICADLYGEPRLHQRLSRGLGAQIIAVSSLWTVTGATRWQAAFAHDWGVPVVAANASGGVGRGSGVFSSKGEGLAVATDRGAQILMATLTVSAP